MPAMFEHANITVSDPAATAAWMEKLFGWHLRWEGDACVVADLGSSNGTFRRLRGPLEVGQGAQLRVGDHLLRLEFA